MGTRGISMVVSGVKVGRRTLSCSIASALEVVCRDEGGVLCREEGVVACREEGVVVCRGRDLEIGM